jgi:predicted mannosyl-3-phosphoglycerate phosphatase (HAD superfamily)
MNVVIYLGMDRYNMDSSKLVSNLNDICEQLQKNQIETVRETVYFFNLYDTNHIEICKTLYDLSRKMDKLENLMQN